MLPSETASYIRRIGGDPADISSVLEATSRMSADGIAEVLHALVNSPVFIPRTCVGQLEPLMDRSSEEVSAQALWAIAKADPTRGLEIARHALDASASRLKGPAVHVVARHGTSSDITLVCRWVRAVVARRKPERVVTEEVDVALSFLVKRYRQSGDVGLLLDALVARWGWLVRDERQLLVEARAVGDLVSAPVGLVSGGPAADMLVDVLRKVRPNLKVNGIDCSGPHRWIELLAGLRGVIALDGDASRALIRRRSEHYPLRVIRPKKSLDVSKSTVTSRDMLAYAARVITLTEQFNLPPT